MKTRKDIRSKTRRYEALVKSYNRDEYAPRKPILTEFIAKSEPKKNGSRKPDAS